MRTFSPLAILGFGVSLLVLSPPAEAALDSNCVESTGTVSCTYGVTGEVQTWTVPAGVTSATFDLLGSKGGDDTLAGGVHLARGGAGGRVRATLTVAPGARYDLYVGDSAGYNGGGGPEDLDSSDDHGGGATDVRPAAGELIDRLLVAGGGGGAGGAPVPSALSAAARGETITDAPGGHGGASSAAGGDGGTYFYAEDAAVSGGSGGSAGTATAGGAGGHSGNYLGVGDDESQGGAGGLGTGGSTQALFPDAGTGGGGGGGWYGGGAGGEGGVICTGSYQSCVYAGGGGGGGGSSYAVASATDVLSQAGVNVGNGKITITYHAPATSPVPPTVQVAKAAGQPDPTSSSPVVFTVTFSTSVTGLGDEPADLVIGGTAGATRAAITQVSGSVYAVKVSGMTRTGTVVLSVAANAVEDAGGNFNLASTDATVMYVVLATPPPDTTAPVSSVRQGPAQSDPTSSRSISFTVTFSEPVVGFGDALSDVQLGGTANAARAIVTGSGLSYDVTVSGMRRAGTVVLTVPAGAARDVAGNASLASATGTDNVVTYRPPRPPDRTAPTVNCSASPGIWNGRADGRMLPIHVLLKATDTGSGIASVRLISVTSSQPDAGLGTRDRPDDLQYWSPGEDDRVGLVRLERYDADRVYTLRYRVTDRAGNVAQCAATTRIPLIIGGDLRDLRLGYDGYRL